MVRVLSEVGEVVSSRTGCPDAQGCERARKARARPCVPASQRGCRRTDGCRWAGDVSTDHSGIDCTVLKCKNEGCSTLKSASISIPKLYSSMTT